MKTVLIMLSTFNGEKYLREQLDSLYAQHGIEIDILVRDDFSQDLTLDILEEYRQNLGHMNFIRGENVGAGPSFLKLIKEAYDRYPHYDYYSFSDQDDVWFPNKIETGVRALEKSNNIFKLFFSGVTNTDSNLNTIGASHVEIVNSFGANLVANHILGCTMLFNRALLEEINKININPFSIHKGKIPIHDGWTAFVAYTLNADIRYDPTSLMYYRQHGGNVIGAGNGKISIHINRIKRYLGKSNHIKSNKCIIALQVLDNIPEENRQLLELVANYKKNMKSKIRLMTDKRMYENNFVNNMETFFMLLFNKY